MFNLDHPESAQMVQMASALHKLGEGAASMEGVANKTIRYLYDHLVSGKTNQKACVLARLFKTHAFGDLEPGLRHFARSILGSVSASSTLKCLTLLATAGEKPEWNSRAESAGHKAIPLPSEKAIESIPMIAGLLSQLGLSSRALLRPAPALLLDMKQSNFNVFYVPEAAGSPYVPAQKEFVIPCKVRTVLGFGGLLPSGDLFAVILFLKVHVPQETADLFKTLELSTRLALIPFVDEVFA